MASITFHPLLEVSKEDMLSCRNSLNLNEAIIQDSINVIIEWWKKQDHLVDALPYITRGIIERILIASQGSLEATKIKIEKIFTTRGMIPEVALNKSFKEFEEFLENLLIFMVSKSNPVDNTRIGVISFLPDHYHHFNMLTFMRCIVLIGEFRTFYDYKFSDRYIIDLNNVKANMFMKFDPIVLKKGETIILGAYGIKVKSIHILNAPTFVDKFLKLLKQVIKEKIANRIFVHKSYKELYEFIGKEALPEDYGGYAPSCKEQMEKWKQYFKTSEAKQIIDASNKFHSNESRRSSVKFNEEYLGMPGSFKMLNLD